MKKSVTKIVKAVLGFAIAIGAVAGAFVSDPKTNSVIAAETDNGDGTYSDTISGGTVVGSGASATITWSIANDNITIVSHSGGGNTVANTDRLYRYNYVEVTASNSYKIANLSITYSTSYRGANNAGGTVITDNRISAGQSNVTVSDTAVNNGTITVTPNSSANTHFFFQNAATGTDNVQLRWSTFKINYRKPSVDHLVLSGVYQTTFNQGDLFNHSGMTVTAVYENNAEEDVTSFAEFSGYDLSSAGDQTVTVTYRGVTTTYDITVNELLTPFITPSKSSTSGYTTEGETLSFTYGNLNSSLNVVSNNTLVVTVDAPSASAGSGTVNLNFVGEGSTTVSFKDGDTQLASVSVSVTVEHGRAVLDPLSVAESNTIGLALEHNNETEKDYYISGIVSKIDYEFGGTPAKATFWLAKDESAYKGFEVYRATLADGADPSVVSNLVIGAQALIHCKIKRYDTTIETGSVAEVVSLEATLRPATNVSLNNTSLNLVVSNQSTLKATITPIYSTDTVSWSTSNGNVATVDQNGKVTAVGDGSATIIVTVGAVFATCSVNVYDEKLTFANSIHNVEKLSEAQSNPSSETFGSYIYNMRNVYNKKDETTYAYMTFATKDLSTEYSLISNHTPVPGAIKQIVFKIRAGSANAASYNAIVSDSEVTSPVSDTAHTKTGPGTITIDADVASNLRYFAISCTTTGANGQLESIEVSYETTAETINTISTRSTLAYKYETSPSLSITAAAIRFGGMISQTLWNRLNTEQTIQGYGTLLATKEYVDDNGGQLSALYNAVDGSNVKKFDHAVAVMPDEANASQKGELVGTYYIWNLFKNVPLNALTVEYVSVAYIRTASGVVFFNQAVASVDGLADALLASPGYNNDSYDGSLKFLSDLN